MIQGRGRSGLLQEAALALGIGNALAGQRLDGDGAMEPRILSAEYHAHSSRADRSLNQVRAQLRPNRQVRHGRAIVRQQRLNLAEQLRVALAGFSQESGAVMLAQGLMIEPVDLLPA